MGDLTTIKVPVFAAIPRELRVLPQWCVHGLDKAPLVARSHRNASTTSPDTWSTFEEARAACEAAPGRLGIGFVLTESDPFTFVDHDGCRDPGTGLITPQAEEIVTAMDSWTEVSVSGTGLHTIVKARLLGPGKNFRFPGGRVEVYDRARFMTLTGETLRDRPVRDAQDVVTELYGYGEAVERSAKPRSRRSPRSASAWDAARDERIYRAIVGEAAVFEKGDERYFPCPLRAHEHDDDPSQVRFSINATTGLWHCFKCCEGGTAWDLAIRKLGEQDARALLRRATR